MFRSHEAAQLATMFNRERETHNQARNRELLAESSSHDRIENVINIENNSFSKKQADKHDEISIHAYDIFISSENETEVDRISSMSIAKKSRK